MDTTALEQQLLLYIGSLEQQGLVDDKLRLCHTLKKDSGPQFFLELIRDFLSNVSEGLNNITRSLDQQAVDYKHLYELYIKLKGSIACIGASKMTNSCSALHHAIDTKSRDGCLLALNSIKNDYNDLTNKLDTVIQLEKIILSQKT